MSLYTLLHQVLDSILHQVEHKVPHRVLHRPKLATLALHLARRETRGNCCQSKVQSVISPLLNQKTYNVTVLNEFLLIPNLYF